MPSCEMCGKNDKLFRTMVEGAEMMLCKDCSRFGKVLAAPKIIIKKEAIRQKQESKPEIIEVIVPDYGKIVKERREKLGLKQEELAKKINEKESLIHKIESGAFEPGIMLARKLEGFLKIKLIEKSEEESVMPAKKSGPVTIGDVISIKTRKAK